MCGLSVRVGEEHARATARGSSRQTGVPVALQRMFYKVKNLDGVTENWGKEKVTGNGEEGSISHR